MRITHIRLENWKNFRFVDIPLQRRLFIIGPNASGKSNFWMRSVFCVMFAIQREDSNGP